MIYQELTKAFFPITAQPFRRGYKEYTPCNALKPYIRCFWTSVDQGGRLIIPDFCADIIFDIDGGEVFFCGVSDESFISHRQTETFGIRFYSWTAALFAEDGLRETLNGCFELGGYFGKAEKELAPILPCLKSTEERIALCERFLVNNLKERRCGLFTEALGEMIEGRGSRPLNDVSKKLHVSSRQLERVFSEYLGLSPKKASMLIRYQLVWRDFLSGKDFNVAEKALEYGYTDQSHLLKDFRRFHTVYPRQAREIALNNVAFLQDCSQIK